jgi:glycopeptide antibiotics resistance protein
MRGGRGVTIIWVARGLYMAVILLATLAGLNAEWNPAASVARLIHAFQLTFAGRDVIDGLRNILLFAGWGAVWMITWRGDHPWRGVRGATLTGAGLSLMVESAQLLSPVRNTSVIDLTTNTVGSFLGALTLMTMISVLGSRRDARSWVGVPASVFAGASLMAVVLEALVPFFRQERIPTAYGGPLERLSEAFALFDVGSITVLPFEDLPLFLPVGFFCVMALVEYGMSRSMAARWVVLGAAVIFPLVEVVRGVTSQPIVAGAALVHLLAVALGAFAAVRWLPGLARRLHGPGRPRALLGMYTLWLILWTWRPFIPDITPAVLRMEVVLIRFIPLGTLSGRVDLFSVVDVALGFCLFLPVGALLAVWPLRRQGWLMGPFPAVYAALLFELGQIPIADRFFDITDALIGMAGGLIGWVVVRRAGFTLRGELLPLPSRKPEQPGVRRDDESPDGRR